MILGKKVIKMRKILKKILLMTSLIMIVNVSFGLSMRGFTPDELTAIRGADENMKKMIPYEMKKMEEKEMNLPLNFSDFYEWSLEYVIIKNANPGAVADENKEKPKDDNIIIKTYIEYRIDEEDLKILDRDKIKKKVNERLKKETGDTLEKLENVYFRTYPKDLVHKIRMITVEEIENDLRAEEKIFGIKSDRYKIKYGKTFTVKRGTEKMDLDIKYSDFKK